MVSEQEVIKRLKEVIDPHTNVNVYDMGLISKLRVSEDRVSLTFTPSSSFCPIGPQLAVGIKRKLKSIEGIKQVDLMVEGYIQKEQLEELLRKL